jgi:TRAP-type C4-dicarboxylate transport system permease small subunit
MASSVDGAAASLEAAAPGSGLPARGSAGTGFSARAGRVFDRTVDVMLVISGLIVFIQALWVSQDVIIRKAFDWTWAPSFELLSYTLVWMTFLGVAAIYRDRGHVVMEAVVQKLPARAQNIVSLITTIAVMFLCLFLLYFTARLTVRDYQEHFILASILNPPKWPIELVIPLSFLMLFIQSIRHVGFYYRAYKSGERITSGEQTSL